MRKLIPVLLLLAACSAPKYTYNFSYYKEGNGVAKVASPAQSTIDPATLTASVNSNPVVLVEPEMPAAKIATPAEEPVSVKSMTHAEKRELKQTIRKEVKEYRAAVKRGDVQRVKKADAQKAMDHDLKLAAIFGAVGLVGLIIGGDVFYVIGGIALIIGVVFFVMWLARQ